MDISRKVLAAVSALAIIATATPAWSRSPMSVKTFDTRDYGTDRHGLAKIEWDDHWLEAQRNSDGSLDIWLVQRFSYDGDWRFYDRADLPGIVQSRPAEQGERQVDDCRKVGPLQRCRHAELVRLPISQGELESIAKLPKPMPIAFYGMTRKPYIVKLDGGEAAGLIAQMRSAGVGGTAL